MNDVLKPFFVVSSLCFFDDILIYSLSWPEHIQQVCAVLQLLLEHHLFLKRSKCSFGTDSVAYLGHIIFGQGVAKNPDKVSVVADWPVPGSVRALRGFLGLTGYCRKFIQDYGAIAALLTKLTKKEAFVWSDTTAHAFVALKVALTFASIDGVASIIVTDKNTRTMGQPDDCLAYHEGHVQFSTTGIPVEAYVLAFNSYNGEGAHILYDRLSLVSSPYIVRPLAYGRGLGRYSGYTFLAVPPFSCTLSQYVDRRSIRTIDKKRFTEEFIEVLGNVVRGLLTLHNRGFYCPKLEGKHIFISNKENLTTAKIWNFRFAETEEKKYGDWSGLGALLEQTARSHDTHTLEIMDLCNKMKNKSLIGMDALRHSALLTVREKFENILALNFYALVHPIGQQQVPSSDPEKAQVIVDLNNFLATNFDWEQKIPRWITRRSRYRRPATNTGAGFIHWLRDIFEHEDEYVPEKVKQSMIDIQLVGRDPDLEFQIRYTWEDIFLEAQNFVAKLNLQY